MAVDRFMPGFLLWVAVGTLAVGTSGQAQTPDASGSSEIASAVASENFAVFGLHLTSLHQSNGAGNFNTVWLAWSPEYLLHNGLTFVMDARAASLRTEERSFFAFNGLFRLRTRLSPEVAIDGGFGFEHWDTAGCAMPMVEVGAAYLIDRGMMPSRIRAGIGYVEDEEYPAYQILLGTEFDLGGAP